LTCAGAVMIVVAVLTGVAPGQEVVDQPGFESGYILPEPPTPAARWAGWEYLDLALLAAALVIASYLALKRRSRRGLVLLTIACVAYFGFYRRGCVCPIGAIQNVALALFDGGYAVPLVILGFFLLPLVFTLLYGRVFCAAVCPLGGLQDLFVWRPVKVPAWVQHALGLLAWVHLGAAVLLVATGSGFLICRYDPFVALFRLSGDVNMLIFGGCFLVVGLFVARPYCRFFCPLGAIMRPLSCVSKYRVTITPDECIKCRLCEDACPFGAIRKPIDPPGRSRPRGVWTLAAMLVLVRPKESSPAAALENVHVLLRLDPGDGRQVWAGRFPLIADESKAFRESEDFRTANRPEAALYDELYTRAGGVHERFRWGGMAFGAFVALVVGLKLIQLAVRRRREDYTADRATCLACGRCYKYCPIERGGAGL